MEPRTLQYIAQACAGELFTGQADALVTRVCTDSRQAAPGDLFIALRGPNFDGHTYLADVARRGAVAALVERSCQPGPPLNMARIVVDDTREALGRLAARYRQEFQMPTIAVGGSNGKSTTKELIASVLRQRFPTLCSEASFNNDIGVPLTLLQLQRHHQAAVLEVGTNHPGELAPLVAMIQPRFGVITSIGREHLDFFGDLDGVLEEEGTLAEMLPAAGQLFLNTASESACRLAPRARASVVRIGWGTGNDWSAIRTQVQERGTLFEVKAPGLDFCGEYEIRLLGRHQVLNALLAAAVGAALGLTAAEVRRGLARCRPLKMRLQLRETGGVRVLDDSYNANADSVLAALQTLSDLPCSGRRIAVLGDMAELGVQSGPAHAEVGRRAAESGLSQLLAVGPMSRLTADAARRAGLREVSEFASAAEATGALLRLVRPGDLVLLKGSRVAGLERVAEALAPSVVSPSEAHGRPPSPRVAWAGALPPPGGAQTPC
ncbi:MAG: UDP-N-acetylmuramoyl-tripeptide--D-alanyl-D-alanine ligase [Verrucomicrobia bacterium]|nr:UDP-N-acetylmuramoyl-tripeptide--D-alanyl-D-alanine ligase [Verrucomicrobiota bacterium]